MGDNAFHLWVSNRKLNSKIAAATIIPGRAIPTPITTPSPVVQAQKDLSM